MFECWIDRLIGTADMASCSVACSPAPLHTHTHRETDTIGSLPGSLSFAIQQVSSIHIRACVSGFDSIEASMISQFFILSHRGDAIIFRDCTTQRRSSSHAHTLTLTCISMCKTVESSRKTRPISSLRPTSIRRSAKASWILRLYVSRDIERPRSSHPRSSHIVDDG